MQPFRQDVLKMPPRLAKKLPTWRQVAPLGCFLAPLGRNIPPSWPQLGPSWRPLGPSWLHLGPSRAGQKWPNRLPNATWSQDGPRSPPRPPPDPPRPPPDVDFLRFGGPFFHVFRVLFRSGALQKDRPKRDWGRRCSPQGILDNNNNNNNSPGLRPAAC